MDDKTDKPSCPTKLDAAIFLPVGVVGFSLFLGWLFTGYYSASLLAYGDYDIGQQLATRVSLLGGIVTGLMLSCVFANHLAFLKKRLALYAISFAFTFPVSAVAFAGFFGLEASSVALSFIWFLAGVGAAFFFVVWSVFFSVINRKNAMVGISVSYVLATIVFLIDTAINSFSLALINMLLPAVSLAFLFYSGRHISFPAPIEVADSRGRLRLLPQTSLVIALYGVIFGLAAYMAISTGILAGGIAVVTVSLGLAGLIALVCYAIRGDCVSFGMTQRVVFPILVAGLLPMPFVDEVGQWICRSILITASVFFSISNYCTLVGYTNKYGLAPFYHVAGGRIPIQLGMLVGFVLGYALLGTNIVNQDVISFLSLGLAFVLVVSTSVVPYESNRLSDEPDVPRHPEGSTLERQCRIVGREKNLSQRELEVFILLAKGRNAPHIGNALFISEHTVKTHTYHIYRKLGVNSQQSLIDTVEAIKLPEE